MRRSSFFAVLGSCLIASASAFAAPPSNGYIGVFGDAAGTDCCITLNKSGNGKVYVYAVTGGASSAGITGAEFKISVEPAAPGALMSWNAASTVNAYWGDPIDNGSGGGSFVSFKDCQTQTGMAGDKVLVGTINMFNLTGEHKLAVRTSDSPATSAFQCPSVLLCDAPAFTQVCLTLPKGDSALGGEDPVAFITAVNSATCSGTSCGFVATEETSWSTIKGLFR